MDFNELLEATGKFRTTGPPVHRNFSAAGNLQSMDISPPDTAQSLGLFRSRTTQGPEYAKDQKVLCLHISSRHHVLRAGPENREQDHRA